MKTSRKVLPFLLCLLCYFAASPSAAFAAAPAITYLHPAGARVGTTAEVTAAGTFDTWPVKVWASGPGVSVAAAKEKGKFAVAVAKDAVPGVYWLRAFNDDGVSTLRPFIVGTLPEAGEKEPNDEFKKPQAIDSNATVNGKLEKAGDVDCFAVALKKGQTLVASVEANHTLKSPMDGVLQILSADGFVLGENNDYHGLDPQVAFTAPKDGTYIARVFAFPATPDASIRFFGSEACVYRLTLTTGPFAEFAVPLAMREPSTAPGAELRGWNIPDRKRWEIPKVAAGETRVTVSDPGLATAVPVRIEAHPCWADVERDPGGHRPRLEIPFSLTGRLYSNGDPLTVALSMTRGQPLMLRVESRTLGLAVNPAIEVFDKDRKRVGRAEPAKLNGDTTLSFTPPADGVYHVAVSDLYGGGGGPRDYFLLRVVPAEPDYDLSAAADRFTVVPGKPTTVPVKVTRRNGFAKPVEIAAEGVPEGVKLEVTTPAKPDPNTVTVVLTADKPTSGPFRLVGTVKDEPKLTRTVRVPLPEFDSTTADLWLTVTPAAKK